MLLLPFTPTPPLDPYIDSFLVQEDFNPHNFANRNPVKVLPTSMIVIGIQYGKPMLRIENGLTHKMGTSGLTGLQTTPKEYVSTGSIGTIIVRFKPGGLTRFTRYPVHEFQDLNVELEHIFPLKHVALLEEQLAYASSAQERVTIVERFFLTVLREGEEDRLIQQIAFQMIRREGKVNVEQLVAESYVSRRTLERKFNAVIGASPKKFATIIRFQHTIRLRKSGYDYLDIVEACGYTDHAHFAKDFKAYAGSTPEQFFQNEAQPELSKTFNEGESLLEQNMYQ
ncbi:helix-turn-helix domain-containing protein [Paenibacillus sp. JDR-2]|uniref:helix-turn-helix domain-containing protein n=1 Tax=Paenibacillus sp. (strain JDR-2) TaxID=324057 RepID=UPI000166A200|nr:helix-turn-helix domain-containing protein [Paenibacillus sp. JDR-2]ACT00417.1 transcriptional regulator, AraC family [Paenibacillus sp. JDR-2]